MSAVWPAIALAVTSVLAAIAAYRAPGRQIAQLAEEARILASLEKGTDARESLQAVVDARAAQLAKGVNHRRDWPSVAAGLGGYALLAFLGLRLVRVGGFWPWAGAVPLFLAAGGCLFMVFDSWRKVPRGEDGYRKAVQRVDF